MSWVHAEDRKLFGEVPIAWVFDAAKAGLIIAFAIASALHAWRRFNEPDEDDDDGARR